VKSKFTESKIFTEFMSFFSASFLSKERQLLENRRRNKALHSEGADPGTERRPSRFDVTPVNETSDTEELAKSRSEAASPDSMNNVPLKSILKNIGTSCPGTDNAGE
jgi:hypothetical protein